MGKAFPPYYFKEDAIKLIDKITKVDEKINALMIEREQYVAELKEKLKEKDTTEA